ncbi:response regulator [Sneathiella limimaris]|uniref:response regulator n=1 Tax=Sneathiella limimaris TaxID=1964213 RepID=UPI00146C62B3|nr:response regulator [Sneathiella limimaris]
MIPEQSRLKRPPTILIVEDSEDDYEAMVRALSREDKLTDNLVHCEGGKEALAYLEKCKPSYNGKKNQPPDLILLDLNMPGISGRNVLMRLKSDAELKNIPIIVLTTSDDPRDIEDCYDAGANTFIVKPVELDNFTIAIQNLKEYWFEVAVLPEKDDPS